MELAALSLSTTKGGRHNNGGTQQASCQLQLLYVVSSKGGCRRKEGSNTVVSMIQPKRQWHSGIVLKMQCLRVATLLPTREVMIRCLTPQGLSRFFNRLKQLTAEEESVFEVN